MYRTTDMFRFEMDALNDPLTVDAEELHCTKVQGFKSHYNIDLNMLKSDFLCSISIRVLNKVSGRFLRYPVFLRIFCRISGIRSDKKFRNHSDFMPIGYFFRYSVSGRIIGQISCIRPDIWSDIKFSNRTDIRPTRHFY